MLVFRSLWFAAMIWLIASNAYKIVLTEKQLDVLAIENDNDNVLRIEEAKRLLRNNSEYKIGYISTLCGYATQSAFTRAFQQIVGQSPQSYRRSIT